MPVFKSKGARAVNAMSGGNEPGVQMGHYHVQLADLRMCCSSVQARHSVADPHLDLACR